MIFIQEELNKVKKLPKLLDFEIKWIFLEISEKIYRPFGMNIDFLGKKSAAVDEYLPYQMIIIFSSRILLIV
jgi:hypothetical protein